MVMIFKDTYEDLTPARLGEIIDAFEAGRGKAVKPGPQVDRILSGPQYGLTTLRDEKAVLKETRDREAAEAARRAKEAAEAAAEADAEAAAATPPPSNAGKPATDAPETSAAISSPSPVELSDKQRSSQAPKAEPATAFKSPELSKGATGGATGKKPAEPAARPSLEDKDRPAAIARPETPDDLKLVSGIGLKIEGILNSLGIYTFAQIAAWRKEERDWVDGYLNFKGRIDRDDWVRQAEALAKGGVEEYVRVFGKDPR
jgi:NADH-quinone oxidoreductase subunit E